MARKRNRPQRMGDVKVPRNITPEKGESYLKHLPTKWREVGSTTARKSDAKPGSRGKVRVTHKALEVDANGKQRRPKRKPKKRRDANETSPFVSYQENGKTVFIHRSLLDK